MAFLGLLQAFSKKKIDDRKEWLTNFMEDRRQRRLHGLPEVSHEGGLGGRGETETHAVRVTTLICNFLLAIFIWYSNKAFDIQ